MIAHRGASHGAPENTLAAFRLAWTEGADGIETDLRLGGGDVVVAIHDADGRRTLRDARKIRSIPATDLEHLDAGSWKSRHWATERVPTLASILAETPPGRRLVLELKEGAELVDRCAAEIESSKANPRDITIIAFQETTIAHAKRRLPSLTALWLTKSYRSGSRGGQELAAKAHQLGVDGVDLEYGSRLDAALVSTLHEEKLIVMTYTVNDAASIRRCAEIGLDALTTDRPAEAISWLSEISA